jgi:hypothetical protein
MPKPQDVTIPGGISSKVSALSLLAFFISIVFTTKQLVYLVWLKLEMFLLVFHQEKIET